MKKNKIIYGFTLIELLIVIVIIGILSVIGLVAFTSTQAKGRDVKRKSDLKQISTSLNLYYSDHQTYPASAALVWGSTFTDGTTVYFQTLPQDPRFTDGYKYVVNDETNPQKYRLYTYLENSQDPNIDPAIVAKKLSCGTYVCNFGISSSDTNIVGTW